VQVDVFYKRNILKPNNIYINNIIIKLDKEEKYKVKNTVFINDLHVPTANNKDHNNNIHNSNGAQSNKITL